MKKVLNLTTTNSKDINNLYHGEYLNLIDLPENLHNQLLNVFTKINDAVEEDVNNIDPLVMIACTELSIIASYFIVFNKDLPAKKSIQDMIEDWNDANYAEEDELALSDTNTKSKGFGILIDAPNFMMSHLQNDIGYLTDTLLVKYNTKIVQSVFY